MADVAPRWIELSRVEDELAGTLKNRAGSYAALYVRWPEIEGALCSGRVRLRGWRAPGLVQESISTDQHSASFNRLASELTVRRARPANGGLHGFPEVRYSYVEVDMVTLETYAADYLLPPDLRPPAPQVAQVGQPDDPPRAFTTEAILDREAWRSAELVPKQNWATDPAIVAEAERRRTRESEIALCEALAGMWVERGERPWPALSIASARRRARGVRDEKSAVPTKRRLVRD